MEALIVHRPSEVLQEGGESEGEEYRLLGRPTVYLWLQRHPQTITAPPHLFLSDTLYFLYCH